MSNTYRNDKAPCARIFSKENKRARKATSRALRRENAALSLDLRSGRSDFAGTALPRHQKTSGWMTH